MACFLPLYTSRLVKLQKELFTGWSVILNLNFVVILETSFKLVMFDIEFESRSTMTVRFIEGSAGITAALHAIINKKRLNKQHLS